MLLILIFPFRHQDLPSASFENKCALKVF